MHLAREGRHAGAGRPEDRPDRRQRAADAEEGRRVRLHAAPTNAAKDDVEIRYSEAAAAVAKADYENMLEANQIWPRRPITEVDVRQAKLEWDKMVLAIEKATQRARACQVRSTTRSRPSWRRPSWRSSAASSPRRSTASSKRSNASRKNGCNPGDTILHAVAPGHDGSRRRRRSEANTIRTRFKAAR